MERRVELALAVERAARERDPLVSNVEDTVYADSEGARRAGDLQRLLRVVRADPVLRLRIRVRRRGGGPHDRHRARRSRAARTASIPRRSEPRRPTGRSPCTARASRRSRRCPVVLDPHVAASFASVIGRTLSADAVQRGRSLFAGKEGEQIADPALRLARRRPRSGGARDGPVRRRGHSSAAHRADRGRKAAAPTCSTPTPRARRGASRPATARAAPTGRRPPSAPRICWSPRAAGRRRT